MTKRRFGGRGSGQGSGRKKNSAHESDRATDDSPLAHHDAAKNPHDALLSASRPRKTARNRVMDLLARRNHSELELRQKLQDDYPTAEIDAAIEFARESKWLLPADELSERVAGSLGRKRKGHRYISQFLKKKGLPPVAKDLDAEIEKGRDIVRTKMARKLASEGHIDYEDTKKVYRLLANRGFDDETIRRVIAWALKPS